MKPRQLKTFIGGLAIVCQCLVAFAAADLADLKAKAEKGDAAAQNKLAASLDRAGEWSAAAQWYRKSAAQGNPEGQTRLAGYLFSGKPATTKDSGVASNRTEAVQLYLKAANQDFAAAQYEIARCYHAGLGAKRDLAEAYKWYNLALKKNYNSNVVSAHFKLLVKEISPEQIADGKKRMEQFKPVVKKPEKPATAQKAGQDTKPTANLEEKIHLKGLSGPPNRRLALINNLSLFTGEAGTLVIEGQDFSVHLVEIRQQSVVVSINGGPNKEIFLE